LGRHGRTSKREQRTGRRFSGQDVNCLLKTPVIAAYKGSKLPAPFICTELFTYYVAVFSHVLVVMGRLWCFALEAIHRIGRTVTFPDGKAVLDGRGDEIFGGSHAFSDRLFVRQVSCDG